MKRQTSKEFIINDKMKCMEGCPVIKGYYLVVGGGKIGTDFLRYARKNKFPFVLVVDKDENAPASKETKVLETESEIINLLRNKALLAFPEDEPELSRADENKQKKAGKSEKENKEKNDEPEAYFYTMDMREIPALFTFGIPEYIIPAVPCHAVAYMLADFLRFFNKKTNTAYDAGEEKSPVTELFIRPEDSRLISFFEDIAAAFPEDVIAGRYPEQGILFLSYAKEGEICPDSCPGPRDHCPTFKRKKPETITEYAGKLVDKLPGWIFESHQMKPGTGGLKGEELKQNMLEITEFVKKVQENNKEFKDKDKNITKNKTENDGVNKAVKIKERAFFIATTCTCHGVLNLFYVT